MRLKKSGQRPGLKNTCKRNVVKAVNTAPWESMCLANLRRGWILTRAITVATIVIIYLKAVELKSL